MAEPQLVVPDEIEDLIVDVLKRRHPEHLAKIERARGLDPQTLERFVTVSHMASADGTRLSGDSVPAVLVGALGTGATPERNEDDALDVELQFGLQVTVLGQKKRDTLRRRDVMAWTTVECLLQRLPRRGLINAVTLLDVENVEESDAQRILGEARIVIAVAVPNMVAIAGGLPADDTDWPAGTPGGPPPDGEPYTPPVELPEPVVPATYTIDRRSTSIS